MIDDDLLDRADDYRARLRNDHINTMPVRPAKQEESNQK